MIGATNAFNMLVGYNGLEAGMGVIILAALGIISYSNGNTMATLIIVITISSLLAFLHYNKYPARVFPGDTLTYPIGAIVAIVAIVGNMERSAAMIFLLTKNKRQRIRKRSCAGCAVVPGGYCAGGAIFLFQDVTENQQRTRTNSIRTHAAGVCFEVALVRCFSRYFFEGIIIQSILLILSDFYG